jgi:hypothetical protein
VGSVDETPCLNACYYVALLSGLDARDGIAPTPAHPLSADENTRSSDTGTPTPMPLVCVTKLL